MNQRIIQKSIALPASLDVIWEKWTTHQGLKTFFGVDNTIELVPGGPFEIYFLMENPVGTRGGEGNRILSYLPKQMLSFTWNAPPSIPEVRNHIHKTWVVVQFVELKDQHTEVNLNHLGWLDGQAWDEAFAYFENAWDIVLNSLQESCKA